MYTNALAQRTRHAVSVSTTPARARPRCTPQQNLPCPWSLAPHLAKYCYQRHGSKLADQCLIAKLGLYRWQNHSMTHCAPLGQMGQPGGRWQVAEAGLQNSVRTACPASSAARQTSGGSTQWGCPPGRRARCWATGTGNWCRWAAHGPGTPNCLEPQSAGHNSVQRQVTTRFSCHPLHKAPIGVSYASLPQRCTGRSSCAWRAHLPITSLYKAKCASGQSATGKEVAPNSERHPFAPLGLPQSHAGECSVKYITVTHGPKRMQGRKKCAHALDLAASQSDAGCFEHISCEIVQPKRLNNLSTKDLLSLWDNAHL